MNTNHSVLSTVFQTAKETPRVQTGLNLLNAAHVTYVVLFVAVIASGVPALGLMLAAEPVLLVAAAQAADGRISLWILLMLTTAASTIGDVLSYTLGRRYGRRALVFKAASRQRIRVAKARSMVHRHGMSTVIAQRWLPPVRGFASVLIGAARMPVQKFLVFSMIGAAIWTSLSVLPVYFVGPQLLAWLPAAVGGAFVVELSRRWWVRRRASRSPTRPPLGESALLRDP